MEWHPLKAELNEQCLRDVIKKYHFNNSEYDELHRCYKRLLPMVHPAVCYKVYDYGCSENREKTAREPVKYVEAVMTLGAAVDSFQDNCQSQKNVSWAYYVECLGMELLSKAYESFDQMLFEELGLWSGDYEYIGSEYPLEELVPMFARLRQKQVTYNSAYALSPRCSVAFVVSLYDYQIHKKTMCERCPMENCSYRKADNPKLVKGETKGEKTMSDNDRIGLTHLYTGDGKGKTTAAVGLAIRALGNGKKVIFTQFMKGRETGEVNCLAGIDGIKIIRNDEDLGWYRRGDEEQAKAFTRLHNSTLEQIEDLIATGEWDMVIMDEITYPYNYGIIDKERLQNLILKKPKYLELVLTGRNPDQFFTDHADYITEMKKIRHPYDKGISAREGIEC